MLFRSPLRDFVGVTRIGFSKSMLVVTPTLGVKTLKDFIELARSRPGKILFSSGGAGSSTHLNAERFRLAAGPASTPAFAVQPVRAVAVVQAFRPAF